MRSTIASQYSANHAEAMVSNYRKFNALIHSMRSAAARTGHRAFLATECVPVSACAESADTGGLAAPIEHWFTSLPAEHGQRKLWLPARQEKSDRSDQIAALLGTENDIAVFDAREGFDPRLFAACAGTLVTGGILLLLTPAHDRWPSNPDIDYAISPRRNSSSTNSMPTATSGFITRLIDRLRYHCGPDLVLTNSWSFQARAADETRAAELSTAAESAAAGPAADWRSEQDQLVDSLTTCLRLSTAQAIVVQADRGRGKSALLGRSAAHTARQTAAVFITAARIQATDVMQRHRRIELEKLGHGADDLPFIAVDTALSSSGDILFVEEASTLPLAVLADLCSRYHHLVFATTVHGYEGAGRGFALRFTRTLDRIRPGWHRLTPTLPVRWSAGDLLEAFINDALLLNVDVPQLDHLVKDLDGDLAGNPLVDRAEAQVRLVEQAELGQNEALLRDVFATLVQAHYQTTPLDLRHLLDQSGLRIWVVTLNKQVCGAALIAMEGNIKQPLHSAILSKQRRLQDQLLPQLLALCANRPQALGSRYARIVRIAVHPDLQRRGLGTRLLQQIVADLESETDAMGASFAADQGAMAFWQRQGFTTFHMGFRRNPRSGLRSVAMLRASAKTVQDTLTQARLVYCDNLRAQQQRQPEYDVLESDVSEPNVPESGLPKPGTCEHHSSDPSLLDPGLLARFAAGERNLNDTLAAIKRLAELTSPEQNNSTHEAILPATTGASQHHESTDPEWLQSLFSAVAFGATSHRQREKALRSWVASQLDYPSK